MPAGIAIDITSPSRGVVQVETIPASALETSQNIVFEEHSYPQKRSENVPGASLLRRHAALKYWYAACGQSTPVNKLSRTTLDFCNLHSISFAPKSLLGDWRLGEKNFIKMHPTTKRKLKIKCWRTQKHLPRVSKRSSRRFAHWKRPSYVSGFSVLKKVVHLHWQETLFKLHGCSALKKICSWPVSGTPWQNGFCCHQCVPHHHHSHQQHLFGLRGLVLEPQQ